MTSTVFSHVQVMVPHLTALESSGLWSEPGVVACDRRNIDSTASDASLSESHAYGYLTESNPCGMTLILSMTAVFCMADLPKATLLISDTVQ